MTDRLEMTLLDECGNHVDNNIFFIIQVFQSEWQRNRNLLLCIHTCSAFLKPLLRIYDVLEAEIKKFIHFECTAQYSIVSDVFSSVVRQIINVISDSSAFAMSLFIGSIFTFSPSMFSASS